MDKKKIGIAIGCAAVIVVIAICAVTFGGKKGDTAEPAATVETAATAEPAAAPEVTATPAPTEAPTATPESTATPEPTAAPTPVVTAAPQPVVTAAPQPAQQEPSSDDGGAGAYDDFFDDEFTGADDQGFDWSGTVLE